MVQIKLQLKEQSYETEDLQEKLSNMILETNNTDMEMHALKDMLASKKSEAEREVRSKEKLEFTIRQQGDVMLKRDIEIQNKSNENKVLKEQLLKSELYHKEEILRSEKIAQERDILVNKCTRTQLDYEEQVLTVTRLLSENQKQHMEIKRLEDECHRVKEDIRVIQRAKENLNRKVKTIEESKLETEIERDELKATTQNLLKELDDFKKEIEVVQKQVDVNAKDRDIAQKNFIKATGATVKQATLVKSSDQSKKELEQEIIGYKEEASKMRKLIFSLEKERERLMTDSNKSGEENLEKDEVMRVLSMSFSDSRKKIADLDKKLKEQQVMYESVRAERNLYSKNLGDTQDEVLEMKKKIKIMGHQIDQLKEEIAFKNIDSAKQLFEYTKLEKEREVMINQMGQLQRDVDLRSKEVLLKVILIFKIIKISKAKS